MSYGDQLMYAVLLALPAACITWTITREEVFRELRTALNAYQERHATSLWRRKLAYMPTCAYCLSHYVAALLVGLFQFKMLSPNWLGYLVSLFAVVFFANIYLTAYNLLRVSLRRGTALADRAEAQAGREKRWATESAEMPKWKAVDGFQDVRDRHGPPRRPRRQTPVSEGRLVSRQH